MSARTLGGDGPAWRLGGGKLQQTPEQKKSQTVTEKSRIPTTKELAEAAKKVQLARDWKGTVYQTSEYTGEKYPDTVLGTIGRFSGDLQKFQQELLAYARVFLPAWAQPFVVSMINAMHTVDALELRVTSFFDGLAINPPEGFMDLIRRLKHAARPIELPVVEVQVAPEVKTFVAPGTGGGYQPSTGVTFRSLGRGRPIVGVV